MRGEDGGYASGVPEHDGAVPEYVVGRVDHGVHCLGRVHRVEQDALGAKEQTQRMERAFGRLGVGPAEIARHDRDVGSTSIATEKVETTLGDVTDLSLQVTGRLGHANAEDLHVIVQEMGTNDQTRLSAAGRCGVHDGRWPHIDRRHLFT
jgi:hypothetical protein